MNMLKETRKLLRPIKKSWKETREKILYQKFLKAWKSRFSECVFCIPKRFLDPIRQEDPNLYFEKLGTSPERQGLLPIVNFWWWLGGKKVGIEVVSEDEVELKKRHCYLTYESNLFAFENSLRWKKVRESHQFTPLLERITQNHPQLPNWQLKTAYRLACINYPELPGPFNRWLEGWEEWDQNVNDQTQFAFGLGPSEDFLKPLDTIKKKKIFFDLVHPYLVNGKISSNSQAYFALKKAIEICNELNSFFGFEVSTIITDDQTGKFLRNLGVDFRIEEATGWIPYKKILDIYSSNRMLFSHFQESWGFPIYENLCLGNPVLCFEEFANPLGIISFQNGLKFSMFQNTKITAAQINDFFESLDEEGLKSIRKQSLRRFSADTFGLRVKAALLKSDGI